MALSFQTEIRPEHVRAATAGIFWRQALQPLVLGPLVVLWLGAHLTLQALFPLTNALMHLSLGLLLGLSVGGMAWVAKRHYEDIAVDNFKRFEGAPVQVSLQADGYGYSASWGQGSIAWGQFQSLWRFKEVWVLLQHQANGISVLLPAQDLDAEAQDFLIERLFEAKAVLK